MKIVQATWFSDKSNLAGRWTDQKAMLFNLALNHSTLSHFYNNIDLYTDEVGYEILVKKLNLKYANVYLDLERPAFLATSSLNMDYYWVLKKLYIYSLQTEPFIHIDNDVYLFEALNSEALKSSLFAQNIEIHSYYSDALQLIQKNFPYIPDWLRNSPVATCHAVNAGLMGGCNTQFFNSYFREIVKFLEENWDQLSMVETGCMNVFLEQCLIKIYADYERQGFKYQMDFQYKETYSYNAYKIHDAPKLNKYIHIMNCKSNDSVEEAIARTLYFSNNDLFQRCKTIITNQKTVQTSNNGGFASEVLPDQYLRHSFLRTISILAKISNNIDLDFVNLESLQKSICELERFLDHNLFDVVMDAFYFEYERYEFGCHCNEISEKLYYDDFWKVKTAMDNPLFNSYRIYLSKNTKIIQTRWLWVEQNEFFCSRVRDVSDNLFEKPGYFHSIIYYYFEKNLLKEQELDPINTLICNYATQYLTVAEMIELLKNNALSDVNKTDLEVVFESRIRFLLHQGALKIM